MKFAFFVISTGAIAEWKYLYKNFSLFLLSKKKKIKTIQLVSDISTTLRFARYDKVFQPTILKYKAIITCHIDWSDSIMEIFL